MNSPQPIRRVVLVLYLLALVASNAVRLAHHNAPQAAPGQTLVRLDHHTQAVDIAVRDSAPDDRSQPVVLLLHGSPAPGAPTSLIPSLAQHYRVVAPDLPGFGNSTLRVADYSIAAHAQDMLALLDALQIDQAHVVAYSMGGGVGLQMYAQAPERVASLTMLSAIGVQEFELFGNYELNHALHGLQLGALTALEWGTPHFGWLDDAMLNTTYARNFYDSDQRALRGILQRFSPPMLIVHGRDDALVPLAAAREHWRIVPHSEIVEIDGGHGLVFTRPTALTEPIAAFIGRVAAGDTLTLAQADAARVELARQPTSASTALRPTGIGLLVLLVLLALATWVTEDLSCIAAGLLVAQGTLPFWPAVAACAVGIYSGDALLFLAGRHLGAPLMQRAPLRWVVGATPLHAARAWFVEHGPVAILVSRFVPGTRLPTYLAAGALGTSFWQFSRWFLLAAALWTPLLVGVSVAFGTLAQAALARYQHAALPVLAATVVTLLVLVRVVPPLFTWRGRRLLLSRWRRITRWEFWPPWIFYPPLLVYLAWLGVRFRGMTVFTAVNPAIPASGVIGESKIAILDALTRRSATAVAATALLPAGDAPSRLAAVESFMRGHDLDWPVVLKPDAGERGDEVCIARSRDAVLAYLRVHGDPTLVQQYAPGQEFGVFYIRHPHDAHGQIFAVTDKRPPCVIGDGARPLAELILADQRAVCMADFFLQQHADALQSVPPVGQAVALTELGTHCRGCVFYDGTWVITPQLSAAIDAISRGYDGFFFGRYDLRTPDIDAFREGRDFLIVELNGVTSEATSIYDPGNGLVSAYRTLARQWRHAFEIGAANRDAGHAVTSIGALLTLWRETRRARRSRGSAAALGKIDGEVRQPD